MPKARQCRPATATAVAAILCAGAAHAEEAAPVAGLAGSAAVSASTTSPDRICVRGSCSYEISPAQMVALAQKLINEKRYVEAKPLLSVMRRNPDMSDTYEFLIGLVALENGDAKEAARRFRAILKDNPTQTRVRIELARAMMVQGNYAAADYHLQLAESDEDLPEDIARMIGNARNVIRSNRRFRFGFDFGFAPDSNINSATAAETVDVNFGPNRIPLELDEKSRARSGLGLTASAYAGVRLPVGENLAMVVDADIDAIKYEDADFDDYSFQLAAGPELQIGSKTRLRLQGVGLYRWYGGKLATRQFGGKFTVQHSLDRYRRIAVQLDGRRTESKINSGYDGWQVGANASFEQAIGKSTIVSASVLARRDKLDFGGYSSKIAGATLGFGGELPMGINAGLSGGAIYSIYDEPQTFFSFERRKDWRLTARAYAGLRQVRIAGFSPSVEYNFQQVDSNYDFYRSDRHRVNFKLARYF